MREAIERVIAELEVKKTEAEGKVEELMVKGNKWLAVGKAYGLEIAINQLKAVLTDGTDNRSTIPRVDGEEAEQVPRQENDS